MLLHVVFMAERNRQKNALTNLCDEDIFQYSPKSIQSLIPTYPARFIMIN